MIELLRCIALAALMAILVFILSTGKAEADWYQATANTLIVADWMQTREIARNPDRWHETNPLLGEHPTIREVNKHFIGSLILFNGVSAILPERWRRVFSVAVIGCEAGFVLHNAKIGLKIRF